MELKYIIRYLGLGATVGLFSMASGQLAAWPIMAVGSNYYDMQPKEKIWMLAFNFIGLLFGPTLAICTMETMGRKASLCVWSFMLLIFWLLTISIYTSGGLYTGKFISGMWCGAEEIYLSAYVGEMVRPHARQIILTLNKFWYFGGFVIESYLLTYVPPLQVSIGSSVAALFLVVGVCFIPETPRFYLMLGRPTSAKKSYEWLHGEGNDEELNEMSETVSHQIQYPPTCTYMFRWRVSRIAMFTVVGLFGVQSATGTTLIFKYSLVSLPEEYVYGLGYNLNNLYMVWLGSSLLAVPLIILFGPRIMFFASSFGTSASMFITASYFFIKETQLVQPWTPMILFISVAVSSFFLCIGITSIPSIMMSEILPIQFKGRVGAIAAFVATFLSSFLALFYTSITLSVGEYLNFVVCAFAGFFGVILSFAIPDTRGQTLEEIYENLSTRENN